MILQYTVPELVLGESCMELDEGCVNVRHGSTPHHVRQHIHLAPLNVHLHEHSWGFFALQEMFDISFSFSQLLLP